MDGVIRVRHVGGGRKKYAFAVPEALAAHCHRGDELLVETRYGLRIARAVTEVLRGAKAEEQAKKAGGREALRPVVGVIAPVVRDPLRIVWVGAEAGDNAEADPLRILGAGTETEDNAEAR